MSQPKDPSRRSFLRNASVAVAGVGSTMAALSPLGKVVGELDVEAWLQSHYKELSGDDLSRVLERLEAEAKKKYKVQLNVVDVKPKPDTHFAYALNLGVCVGCRRCAEACQKENNVSRAPGMQYIRVLEMEKGGVNLETANHHYDPEQVPKDDKYYMPVQCHQCDNPPCVKACPVKATWKEDDGIVVVDYNWCIGCRYCEAACPYWARRFNFSEPVIPREEFNTETAYLSNRPRSKGVMEKCTFCLHRTREGKYPACLEVCPTGARAFGNLLDPDSEIRYILENKRVFVLKEDVGTIPNFFYFFEA